MSEQKVSKAEIKARTLKRVFSWVDPVIHKSAKIAAAEADMTLEAYVGIAVAEKLARDSGRRVIPIDRRSH